MSKFISVTFHHTSKASALRAIERERGAGLYHRALLWDCGKMGCVTRFYSLVLPIRAPGQRVGDYMHAVLDRQDNAHYVEDLSDFRAEKFQLQRIGA